MEGLDRKCKRRNLEMGMGWEGEGYYKAQRQNDPPLDGP
jgi:hypothetical protein